MTLSKKNITTLNSFLLKEGFPKIAEDWGKEELKTFLNTARNRRHETPLFVAAEKGQFDVAKLLIDSGADVNLANAYGFTPLHVAAEKGHTATAQLLIEKGANVNLADEFEATPLFIAALFGRTAVAKLLLEKGADVDQVDIYGRTPLDVAAENGHTATAQLLLFAKKLSARPDVRLLPQTMNADPIIKQILDCNQYLFKYLRDNLNLIAKEDKDELSNSPSTSNTTTEPINTSQIALKALYEHFVRGDNLPQLLKTFIARTSPDQINRFNRFNLNDPQSLLTSLPKLSEKGISAEISTNIAQYAGPFSKKRLESLLEAHFNGEEPQDLSHVARLAEKRAQEQVTGAQPNGR